MVIQLFRLARASRRCRPRAVVEHDPTGAAAVETTVACAEVRTRGRKPRRAQYLVLRIPAARRRGRHCARADRPPRRRRRIRATAVGLPLVGLTIGAAPAWGDSVVNYTFHVPASVQTNPCFPADVVNLNGDIHVVITSTADRGGGYHMNTSLNSQLSGASITTGTRYVNSENQQEAWYAGAPFPTVHTNTYDFQLISQSATPNYVLHMQMHQTVTANGVPVAAPDHFSMDCRG
jgi:hypothetical protein